MSLHKLCLFTLAATLAGSTTVGMLNVQIREYEVPTPKSRPHDPALAHRHVPTKFLLSGLREQAQQSALNLKD